MGSKTKILVAEDSNFMRLVLKDIFSGYQNEFELLEMAENGEDAFQKTKELQPDIVLLDLLMPDYDGKHAIRKIMQACPTPILLLTAVENKNMVNVFEALELGAFDFVIKPSSSGGKIRDIEALLLHKVRQAASINLARLTQQQQRQNNNAHTFDNIGYQLVVIGASTGGTGAIEDILKLLPNNFPIPIVIAQHIPMAFLSSFAERLDKISPLRVKIAQNNEPLLGKTVYLLPSDTNTQLQKQGERLVLVQTEKQFAEYNNPSVDALFLSCADTVGNSSIAVLLTGMGRDGAMGMKALFQQGAFTIAQDEATSVVFGMPKEAIEQGSVRQVLPIHEIGSYVVGCLSVWASLIIYYCF